MSSPNDAPYTIVHNPGAGVHQQFTGPVTNWHPDDSPLDPHDEPYSDIGDDLDASKVTGPLPPNIVRGPFSRSKGH